MKRRTILMAAGVGVAGAVLLRGGPGGARVWPGATPDGTALVVAARAQVGVTVIYDPAYVALGFPGGDVPSDRGVCTDVVIRALRVAQAIDLQAVVNADMKAGFAAYPPLWGLSRPDRNIDHRRVPNLRRLFERVGAEPSAGAGGDDFMPGDIVTSVLPGNLPHVMVVSDEAGEGGQRPMVVHNIGAGAKHEDRLFDYPQTGHYRLTADVLARMRDLQAGVV